MTRTSHLAIIGRPLYHMSYLRMAGNTGFEPVICALTTRRGRPAPLVPRNAVGNRTPINGLKARSLDR